MSFDSCQTVLRRSQGCCPADMTCTHQNAHAFPPKLLDLDKSPPLSATSSPFTLGSESRVLAEHEDMPES